MTDIKLPALPPPDYIGPEGSRRRTDDQVRAIQIAAMRAGLEAAAKVCSKRAQEAYVRYRSEGSAYDDGGCDMGNTLEFDLRNLRIEGETNG